MKFIMIILALINLLLFNAVQSHPIDGLLGAELLELVEPHALVQNETNNNEEDKVYVLISNEGGYSEYVSVRFYLPEKDYLLESNSILSGNKSSENPEVKAAHMPITVGTFEGDETFKGIQSTSTNTFLRSSMTMSYSKNYKANKESQDNQVTKLNNQFLSVVDLYSLDPTNLEIKLSSANYGEGNYPDLAKHMWIIRTHDGYFLKLNFRVVQIEDDLDTIEVYKFEANGDKNIVDNVKVAKQLVVNSNQLVIVFKSDCTVNKRGFQATAKAIKSNNRKESTTLVATTPEIPTTQRTSPEKAITQNITRNAYRHKMVLDNLPWAEARSHCMNEFHGDLIQYDNRILTVEGRRELQKEILGMEDDWSFLDTTHSGFSYWHIGIRRDPDDISTWRRIGDDQAVELSPDGWLDGYPTQYDLINTYLRWYYNNMVYNGSQRQDNSYFICEYIFDDDFVNID